VSWVNAENQSSANSNESQDGHNFDQREPNIRIRQIAPPANR
jgi:hypothetical protein